MIENIPVVSDIPTLILAGEFDPITPPIYGEVVAETLNSGYYFGFSNYGHGVVINGGYPLQIAQSFLANPRIEPDGSCINDEVDLTYSIPLSKVTLQSYKDDVFGLSGLVPEGWSETGSGVFSPSSASLVLLVEQLSFISLDDLIDTIEELYFYKDAMVLAGTRATNSETWVLYETEHLGLIYDVAIADHEGFSFFILLQSPPLEREFLYEQVFIPVMDAFQMHEA